MTAQLAAIAADPINHTAVRAVVHGDVQGVGFRHATVQRARELSLKGWVRNGDDGSVALHAEGDAAAVARLLEFVRSGPRFARVTNVDVQSVAVEGHEQFAVRGVPAGVFVVQEHRSGSHHFDLRLEVGGVMRSWALPKGPSLDPAVKRFAIETADHDKADNATERPQMIVWDLGVYEQGGRVAWPEALDRGHAVFVLHGQKLRGGFALQRTRAGAGPQWLLIKRSDEHARPGSDVVAEQPASPLSGRTPSD